MSKKIILMVLLSLFILTGCGEKVENNNKNNQKKLDHEVYKYMKISNVSAGGLINVAYMFDTPGAVGHGNEEYDPCLIVQFDTTTGKAISVKFYSFFLDYKENDNPSEWVDKAIVKFSTSTGEYKKSFSNVSKGRVDDFVTYLVADVDPKSYIYNQYIESLFYEQNIEKYKEDIFYSRLYNYDVKPEAKEGSNYFEEPLEGIRIEWSNNEISAY